MIRSASAKRLLLFVVGMVLSFSFIGPFARAAATDCSFTISPSSVAPGSDNYAVFSLTNNSATTINSVVFNSPDSQKFTIQSNSAYRWQSSNTSAQATFTDGSLYPGQSFYFSVEFVASGTPFSAPLQWTVQASEDPTGTSPIDCGGDGSMNIVSQPSIIAISDVGLSAISDHVATIEWITDTPATSQINYGRTADYGQSTTINNQLVTDHVVVIENLQASAIYHYQVTSTTPDGGTASQGDNTFLTAVSPKNLFIPPLPVETTLPIQIVKPGTFPILKVPTEKLAPTISITTKLPAVTKTLPTISGLAQDNVAIARVDYSLDGGKSWLPVDTTSSLGTKQAGFSFTVGHLDDANYYVVVRAIDTSGNIGKTAPSIVVIDRLPPIFSNLTTAFGSQSIEAASDGRLQLAVNGTYRVTGQAVGGATIVNILAHSGKGRPQSYSLLQDSQSGLWSGSMSFTRSGTFYLSVYAKDGAGNITDRQLGAVQITPAGSVTDTKRQPIKQAQVTLYYFEPSTKHWVVWDGAPYGVTNPQPVKQGSYTAMVPAGQYYLKVTAAGYRTVISERFTVARPHSLNQSFKLTHTGLVSIGSMTVSLPTWPKVVKAMPFTETTSSSKSALVGNSLPAFNLPTLDGGNLQKVDLFGKPTDITLLDTWSPGGVDQLGVLSRLQRNQDIGVVPVFEGQSAQSASAYVQLANLKLTGLADPDNSLAESLQAGPGPRHLFIDRTGHIKKVMVGVLSEEEILQTLGGM